MEVESFIRICGQIVHETAFLCPQGILRPAKHVSVSETFSFATLLFFVAGRSHRLPFYFIRFWVGASRPEYQRPTPRSRSTTG
jgi:hypothetical protein